MCSGLFSRYSVCPVAKVVDSPLIHVQLWVIEVPNALDVLRHVIDFGAAIAFVREPKLDIRGREVLDVGIGLPYHPEDESHPYTHRKFIKHLFAISNKIELPEGLTSYDMVMSFYVPGDWGYIPLDSCWYAPEGFKSSPLAYRIGT